MNPRGTPKEEPHTSGIRVELKKASPSLSKTDVPDCPHELIKDIYHELMPECPRVRVMEPIKADLRARWRESKRHQSLEFWRWYFSECRQTFWFADDNDRAPPGLRTMVRKKNFYGVINLEYSR